MPVINIKSFIQMIRITWIE